MSISEETASICKRRIESLETWLRRLINDVLTRDYGKNYFVETDVNGVNVIKNSLIQDIERRQKNNPERFSRLIDATLLNHLIDIVCNSRLFDAHFDSALRSSFDDEGNLPSGHLVLRNYCERLLEPRNRLFHSNPISVHQAEQVLCITSDLIESLKKYYRENGMEQDFNSPLILSVIDNKGVKHYRDSLQKTLGEGTALQLQHKPEYNLYPGDKVSISVDVDSAFDGEYETFFVYRGMHQKTVFDKQLTVNIEEAHIGVGFEISVTVMNTNVSKGWSRMQNGVEDAFWVRYRVLPNR